MNMNKFSLLRSLTMRPAKLVLCLIVSLAWISDPAQAQSYNYRIGDTRVQAGHNGLAGHSSTYITSGTLSRSAQAAVLPMPPQIGGQGVCGMTPGVSANPMGLQSARMGSTVGMAGDYMRSDLNPNWSITQRQQAQQGQYRQQQYQIRQPVLRQAPPPNYTTYGTATGQNNYHSSGVPASGGASYGSGSSGYKGY